MSHSVSPLSHDDKQPLFQKCLSILDFVLQLCL